ESRGTGGVWCFSLPGLDSRKALAAPVVEPLSLFEPSGEPTMRAVQVSSFGAPVALVEVPEPEIVEPTDVIVRIAGAGICRTDIHIQHGELAEAFNQTLPLTIGHENSGWVHAVGPAVTHLAIGDPVIVHPAVTCGHCAACRAGTDMHCATWRFPGVDGWPGGDAELLPTRPRALVT